MDKNRTHSHGEGICMYTDSMCKAYREQLRIIEVIKASGYLYPDEIAKTVQLINGETNGME